MLHVIGAPPLPPPRQSLGIKIGLEVLGNYARQIYIYIYFNSQIGRGEAEGAKHVCDTLARERERGGGIL